MKQVTDLGAIEPVIDEIIAANPGQVEAVNAKPTMLGWFVGQALKASGGKANPQALNELLKKKLGIRGLLDVIPLDPTLVKGSHGRDKVKDSEKPLLIGSLHKVETAQDIHSAIREHFRGRSV